MESKNEDYIKAYQKDSQLAEEYYLKFLAEKSEQQKFFEKIINDNKPEAKNIADIACGAGTLTYHLSKLYPEAKFSLVDINESALALASKVLDKLQNKEIIKGSIFELNAFNQKFDIVCCWQTILALDEPRKALEQLINSCKKGGKLYISSLYNFSHDVDVFSHFIDHTRESAKEGLFMQYNTISLFTLNKWLEGKVESYTVHQFNTERDFTYDGRGIGTYTVKETNGHRLQISGGMLMNWGILEITK